MSGRLPAVVLAWVALGLAACTGKLHLGVEPSLWHADHESGDLSQWIDGITDAGASTAFGGTLLVENEKAHSGKSAVLATIATANGLSSARLNRLDVPEDAYFCAWFYIPRRYTIVGYWDLFELQGVVEPTGDFIPVTLWSVNLRDSGSTGMTWYVWDNLHGVEHHPAVPLAAPVDRWFQIKAWVHRAADASGRISVWIDDKLLADVTGVPTALSAWLGWSIGSTSNAIAEPLVESYLDDAAIFDARK